MKCFFLCVLIILFSTTAFLRNSLYGDEVDLWRSSIEVSPGNPRGWRNLGTAQIREGRSKEALQSLLHSLNLDPTFYKTFYNLGLAYKNLGMNHFALSNFNKAIQLYPSYPQALLEVGNTHLDMGELNEAENVYQNLLQRSLYTTVRAKVLSSLAVLRVQDGRFEETVKITREALAL